MVGSFQRLLGRFGAIALAATLAGPAQALTVIRDAEIEQTIHRLSDPLFEAAGLDVASVDIYLIRDPVLNAFVAGGQNLFLNTGLLLRTNSPDELRGVIAHETGHIAGGHLSRRYEAQEQAMTKSLIGAALGLAAAVAGAPQLATAFMAGGATVGQRGLLAFSRTQEQSADQAAVTFLGRLQESPAGLRDFFKILETQNLRVSGGGNVYLRTHPLTSDRINFIDQQVQRSPYRDNRLPADLVDAHERMRAKLDGYLSEPQDVLRRRTGDGLLDRYARAVALYRVPDLDASLVEIDRLIAEEPNNPYFHELKGQVLFENGRVELAVAPYRDAVRLRPDSALLRFGLAQAMLEQNDPAMAEEAVALLREAVRIEPSNASAWRLLGIAYGKLGRDGPASMALAEQSILTGNKADAQLYVGRAQRLIKPGDPDWVRLQDQLRAVEDLPDPKRRR
jgi:predicted Zn-dependent protease